MANAAALALLPLINDCAKHPKSFLQVFLHRRIAFLGLEYSLGERLKSFTREEYVHLPSVYPKLPLNRKNSPRPPIPGIDPCQLSSGDIGPPVP